MMKSTFKRHALRASALAVALALGSAGSFAHVDDSMNAPMKLKANRTGSTDRLIIKYKVAAKGAAAATMSADRVSSIATQIGQQVEFLHSTATGAHVLKLDHMTRLTDVEKMAAKIAADPNVEYAQPDYIKVAYSVPNDPQYSTQWHYFEAVGGINAPGAWDLSTGTGVVVAVIDTGYRPHADLAANVLPGYDMVSDSVHGNDGNGRDSDATDPGDSMVAGECGDQDGDGVPDPAQDRHSSWHGTHVSGTIAALGNNGVGVTGVAYNAKILPVRVLGKCGGYTSDINDGMIWAVGGSVPGVPTNTRPAKVLNMSLGGIVPSPCSAAEQSAINLARSKGAVVVVAAGNDSSDANTYSPGNCTGVISVAATGRDGGPAFYTNTGTSVDIAAPGGTHDVAANDIFSTYNAGQTSPGSDSYNYLAGTSMAAPHISGVAALLFAAKSTLTPDQVESAIKTTARAFPKTCTGCGTGIVDATAAVKSIINPPPPNVLLNGVPVTGLSGAKGSNVIYTMTVPAGASNLKFVMSGGTGDGDLYVKFGSAPTTGSYDCRPWQGGNNESCPIPTAQAGTYYVMINGYDVYSGVTLTGSYGSTPPPLTETESNNTMATANAITTSGATISAGIGSTTDVDYFKVTVGAGKTFATTMTPNANSDYDLFIYNASGVQVASSERGKGLVETTSVTNTGASAATYYAKVIWYTGTSTAVGSYTLKATF